ncbi:hypothetical protein CEXT_401401 [Caerostris extrusa]|uniref:Uncharacterized protein n=1 Tax=Caerostris extrusa TaxID=172846 RepID=A0AAV4PR71_CAEEX|nr:hypothetical protein CEXT_401401 [Caerostris extrusa]
MNCKREGKKEHFPVMIRNAPPRDPSADDIGAAHAQACFGREGWRKCFSRTPRSQSILGDILRVVRGSETKERILIIQ